LRLFSFGGYGLALAALAPVVFGAIECPPAVLSIGLPRIVCNFENLFPSLDAGKDIAEEVQNENISGVILGESRCKLITREGGL